MPDLDTITERPDAETRHAMRGAMNALKLAVAVLEAEMPAEESLEFVAYLEHGADKLIQLIDDCPQLADG